MFAPYVSDTRDCAMSSLVVNESDRASRKRTLVRWDVRVPVTISSGVRETKVSETRARRLEIDLLRGPGDDR